MNRQDADASNSSRLPSFRLGAAEPRVEIEAGHSNPILKIEELHIGTKIQDVQFCGSEERALDETPRSRHDSRTIRPRTGSLSSAFARSFAKVALLIEVDLARLEAREGSKELVRVTSSPASEVVPLVETSQPWRTIRTGALVLWANLRRTIVTKAPAWKTDAWPWIAAMLATLGSAALLSEVSSPAAGARARTPSPIPEEAPLDCAAAPGLPCPSGPAPRSCTPGSERPRDLAPPSGTSTLIPQPEPMERRPKARSQHGHVAKRKRATVARKTIAQSDGPSGMLYSGKDL